MQGRRGSGAKLPVRHFTLACATRQLISNVRDWGDKEVDFQGLCVSSVAFCEDCTYKFCPPSHLLPATLDLGSILPTLDSLGFCYLTVKSRLGGRAVSYWGCWP